MLSLFCVTSLATSVAASASALTTIKPSFVLFPLNDGQVSSSSSSSPSSPTHSSSSTASSLVGDTAYKTWTTEHHDERNSGYTADLSGPVDSSGICRAQFFKDDPIDPSVARFYSVGVSNNQAASGGSYFFFGGTDNKLRIVKGDIKSTKVDEWTCDLASLVPGADQFGMVSSGTVWNITTNREKFAVASGSGYVYALNFEKCLLDSSKCTYTSAATGNGGTTVSSTSSSSSLRTATSTSTTPPVGDDTACLAWSLALDNLNPSFSPTRYVPVTGISSSPYGIILASSTNRDLNTGGSLVAINSETGNRIWAHTADEFGASSGLIGVVPAVDASRGFTLYLAYSSGVVALNPINGQVIGKWQDTVQPIDPIVASVTITPDFTTLFTHSVVGTVRSFTISGNSSSITFTPKWACDYTVEKFKNKVSPCVAGVDGRFQHPSDELILLGLESDNNNDDNKKKTNEVAVHRSEFVTCGWPQPTTRAQRAELWEEIRSLYKSSVATPIERLLASSSSLTEEQQCKDITEMARQIPSHTLHAIVTPSGYKRRSTTAANAASANGKEKLSSSSSPLDIPNPYWFEADFPYATVSLLPNNDAIVVPQYVSLGNTTGVFVADIVTGAPIWEFDTLTYNFTAFNGGVLLVPFGRSRSSPAVDKDGNFFVGADLVCKPPFDCTDTEGLPALFAFKPTTAKGKDFGTQPVWVTNMGLEATIPVGASSPMLRNGVFDEKEVYFVAYDGSVGITIGESCPTSNLVLECSNRGVCNCATGICSCQKCYGGKDCNTYDTSQAGCDSGNLNKKLSPGEIAASIVVPFVALICVFSSIVSWQKYHPGRPMSEMFSFIGGGEAAHAPLIGTGGGGGGGANSRYS